MTKCICGETDTDTVSVYPAAPYDGACNACSCDEYGHYPTRQTFVIRLRGLSFRLCDVHMGSVVGMARLSGWRPSR